MKSMYYGHQEEIHTTALWLQENFSSGWAGYCRGCADGLENQQGHECMMFCLGYTESEFREHSFNKIYDTRNVEEIKAAYKTRMGEDMLVAGRSANGTDLLKLITKRYYVENDDIPNALLFA
jgi:hypothetical protein